MTDAVFIGHMDRPWRDAGGDYTKREYQMVGIFGAVREVEYHQQPYLELLQEWASLTASSMSHPSAVLGGPKG